MICTEYDQWLKDQDKTIWVCDIEIPPNDIVFNKVEISIYQDDGRPGLEEPNSWIRLKRYLDGSFKFKQFHCQFRDHRETLPVEYPDGIYFSKGVIADMLNPHPCNCYVLGWIKDGLLTKVWYRIPEVIEYQREETRDFDRESPAIIWCNG